MKILFQLGRGGCLLDSFGRKIEYLRISVTERCNLNCIYCKPDKNSEMIDKNEQNEQNEQSEQSEQKEENEQYKMNNQNSYKNMISPEEYGRIVHAMATAGIKKVRITGGEPLLRPDICEIIKAVSAVKRIDDISLTTNGILLGKMALKLKEVGLKRVNISLDSLRECSFKHITGSSCLDRVMEGIEKSLEAGLGPVKLNTVLIRGINDDEIDNIIGLAKELPIDVRFIELMPIGDFGEKNADKIVYSSEIISTRPYLKRLENVKDRQPAEYYSIDGYNGRIGFISPMGHKFCKDCNRIRLTSDGKVRLCLGNNSEVDLMKVLKEKSEELDEFIKETVYSKPEGHNFEQSFSSDRNMNAIGG